jgi:hypothetical protein
MGELWNKIKTLQRAGEPLDPPYASLLVTRDPEQELHWLVGPHPALSDFATKLRTDPSLSAVLEARDIRLGFRRSDRPPLGATRQESYGAKVVRAVADHTAERTTALLPRVRPDRPEPTWRISDRLENVLDYWSTQTPQAHHIVEFNNLEKVGVSHEKGSDDLDYKGLPCVLLMAEFHQRYISSHLKPTHGWPQRRSDLLARLRPVYESIYTPVSGFASLWNISVLVFEHAERALRRG